MKPPPPVVDGAMSAAGLHATVTVVRDRWGIPHISATDTHDLFFAQGFVQAQDRLFQIDLWRRAAQGRLAEVLGANFIERDAMTRRMQYRGPLAADWASYGPETRDIASAFVEGINAWIDRVSASPPPEFSLAGWRPEKWRAEDLLNRTDSFVLSSGARDEVLRARLIARLGADVVDEILPLPDGARTIVSRDVDLAAVTSVVWETIARAGTAPFFTGFAAPLSAGSNAWAIPAASSHRAVVGVDPHRPFDHPSSRYLVHLTAPSWNVIGATAPWRPGVAIGHNENVAWGYAAMPLDSQDLFVEQTNPRDSREVRRDGRWVAMEVEHDAIAVKGRGEPFEYDRLYTSNGVVVGLDSERQLAYVLNWTGTASGTAAELGALGLDRSRSGAEFLRALPQWLSPPAEFVFAERVGGIGRQFAARFPERRNMQGATPAAGSSGQHWITNATTRPVDDRVDAGIAIATNFDPARAQRVDSVLKTEDSDPVERSKRLQLDVHAPQADRLIPLLSALRSDDAAVETARRDLLLWDRRISRDSSSGALFVAWRNALARALATARVPAEFVDDVAERLDVVKIMTLPTASWFGADAEARRNRVALAGLKVAIGVQLPKMVFAHPLGVSDAARRRFNIGPFALPGDRGTVFAVSADRKVGPSFRAIFDTGAWDRSIATAAPGQSEAPGSPHFSDLAALWAKDEYFPLVFSEAAIAANKESTLTLTPLR